MFPKVHFGALPIKINNNMRNIINTILLFSFLTFSPLSLNAEIFKVYVDGEEISNGSIATSYEINKHYIEVGALVLVPWVLVEVLEPCHLAVTVENTTPGKPEIVQFCWLGNCNPLEKGESLTKEHDFLWSDTQNLNIDAIVSNFNKEQPCLVSSKVSIIANKDKQSLFSFDLNMVYMPENSTEIKTISDSEEKVPIYYDLNGNIINNPTKGLYIVRQGEKVYKICL